MKASRLKELGADEESEEEEEEEEDQGGAMGAMDVEEEEEEEEEETEEGEEGEEEEEEEEEEEVGAADPLAAITAAPSRFAQKSSSLPAISGGFDWDDFSAEVREVFFQTRPRLPFFCRCYRLVFPDTTPPCLFVQDAPKASKVKAAKPAAAAPVAAAEVGRKGRKAADR